MVTSSLCLGATLSRFEMFVYEFLFQASDLCPRGARALDVRLLVHTMNSHKENRLHGQAIQGEISELVGLKVEGINVV